jgi:Fe2+ transport system protein B
MIENKTDIENETFSYSYSSIRREEIEKIRSKYIQNQEDDLNELRRLDNHITNTATFAAIFVGIMGLLVFGTGLSLVLSFSQYALGILVGFLGLLIMGAGLFVNKTILKKLRDKYGNRIIELSDKLLK